MRVREFECISLFVFMCRLAHAGLRVRRSILYDCLRSSFDTRFSFFSLALASVGAWACMCERVHVSLHLPLLFSCAGESLPVLCVIRRSMLLRLPEAVVFDEVCFLLQVRLRL